MRGVASWGNPRFSGVPGRFCALKRCSKRVGAGADSDGSGEIFCWLAGGGGGPALSSGFRVRDGGDGVADDEGPVKEAKNQNEGHDHGGEQAEYEEST